MKKKYLTFVRQFRDLREGKQEIFIKDLSPGPRKYDTKHVFVEISSDPDRMSGGDILRIRSESGILHTHTWGIKIIKELPESLPGKPWEDVFKAIGNH